MEFRALREDEIECRVGQIARSGNSLSLLMYKTARVDQDLLDEVVGPEDWQCRYEQIGNELFCTVSVWSEKHGQWIEKQDVGSPSNMEAEKGRASDAFKRACFKLGIGRELYTAPRIRVSSRDCNIRQGQNGRPQCYDSFSVDSIDIRDHQILYVSIRNDDLGRIVYAWAKPGYQDRLSNPQAGDEPPSREQLEEMSGLVTQLADQRGVDNDKVISALMDTKSVKSSGVKDGEILTARQAATAIGQLRTWIGAPHAQ